MFKKILLPIDLTDRHQRALSLAADLARSSGGEVLLLHVIENIPGLESEEGFYRRLEQVSSKHLGKLSEQLTAQNIPSRALVLVGKRGRDIVRQAREWNADLVILTAPRIDSAHTLGLGSLSYQVGVFAPCTVLLVK
jgi:nucleotide-binding universal stress UspA family protein